MLLTREEFVRQALLRDQERCVGCQLWQGRLLEVHHLLERTLFPDGGYYLDNAVSLCAPCHWKAENTLLDPETLRAQAGIQTVVLPPGFDPAFRYTKWGDVVHADGTRTPGPLFWDERLFDHLTRVGVIHLYRY